MATIEVKVPDIGDFKDVPVIELLAKPGDAIEYDTVASLPPMVAVTGAVLLNPPLGGTSNSPVFNAGVV